MKNWITSLVGALGGSLIAIQPVLESGKADSKQVLIGFVVALLGFLSKDFNKTGK